MSDFILSYSKAAYERKLGDLDDYYRRLGDHLKNMKGYASQIDQFWHDSMAQDAYTTLTELIRQVENAMERTDELRHFYRNAIDQFDAGKQMSDGLIDEALEALKKLGS
jgi:hypothetical protein